MNPSVGAAGSRSPVCVTQCPKSGTIDVSQLVRVLQSQNKTAGIGAYSAPSSHDVQHAVGRATGGAAAVIADAQRVQKQVEEERAERERQLQELQAKQERERVEEQARLDRIRAEEEERNRRAIAQQQEEQRVWRTFPHQGQLGYLRSLATGNYVCADANRGWQLVADRPHAAEWERFMVVDGGSGRIGFRSAASGKYVCADFAINTAGPAHARDRNQCLPWEQFDVVRVNADTFGLRSSANGQFLCADLSIAGYAPLHANRGHCLQWEQFKWQLH